MFDNPEIAVIGAADAGQDILIVQNNGYAFVQKHLCPGPSKPKINPGFKKSRLQKSKTPGRRESIGVKALRRFYTRKNFPRNLGAFPALCAGNRAFRSNNYCPAEPVNNYSTSIPCAFPDRRFFLPGEKPGVVFQRVPVTAVNRLKPGFKPCKTAFFSACCLKTEVFKQLCSIRPRLPAAGRIF
jgi:hypothetical protein